MQPKTEQDVQRPALPILIQPRALTQLSGLRIVLDERGWPRAAIAEGPILEDSNRLALYAATEFEESTEIPSNQPGQEWLHLAKARNDLERSQINDLSGKARFGGNPPDFVLENIRPLTVEMAQFTHSERREALSLLRAIKKAVISAPRQQFQHLRDRLVLIGFEDRRGLPPRASDRSAIENVLDSLRNTDPGPPPRTIPETIEKHGFHVLVKNSPLGQGEAACFPLPVLPHSDLARACGFEIAASLTIISGAAQTETELARLTTKHDVSGNDILVISAGAPAGFDGFPLISEEVAVEPAIMQTLNLPQPKYLKRILLHRWSFGDLYELFPNYSPIVESEIDCGGPCVVPVGTSPEWGWNSECPCGSGVVFRQCHGI